MCSKFKNVIQIMIYLILSNKKTQKQNQVVAFLNNIFKSNNLNYKLIFGDNNDFVNNHEIDRYNDCVFTTPEIAAKNIELILSLKNTIVVLEKPSILIQKLSKNNPINENFAVNHSIQIMYIFPNENDSTNDELRIVVQNDTYVLSEEKFLLSQGIEQENQVLNSNKKELLITKKSQIYL